MLASLTIQNLALVDHLEWEPEGGFVAVTGETGAGKSVILGALQLVLGERADRSIVRSGAEQCRVEAVFQIKKASSIHDLLAAQGVPPCEDGQLLIRRIVPAEGAGRQFLNGAASTLAMLREIGNQLIDLHGPHDHQSLFSTEAQTLMLDAFAGADSAREAYQTARSRTLRLQAERDTMQTDERTLLREEELLAHQVNEIAAAEIRPDEEEALLEEQRIGSNARRILELGDAIRMRLSEAEDSALAKLADAARHLRELSRIDSRYAQELERLDAVLETIKEVERDLASRLHRVNADPSRLAKVEARIDSLETLKRKYGPELPDVLHFFEEASSRLDDLRNRERRKDELGAEIEVARKEQTKAAAALTAIRLKASEKLSQAVAKELAGLGFSQTLFEVKLASEDTPLGAEKVEFLFAPNPGEPPARLRDIASSGEISRVMLALKSVLAAQDQVPVLIFDEIDANVGGEVATRVGERMRTLGKSHQVFCISHLPQVAAAAGAHYLVVKEVLDGRTVSRLRRLTGSEREDEIARMLGGRNDKAILLAKELLAHGTF